MRGGAGTAVQCLGAVLEVVSVEEHLSVTFSIWCTSPDPGEQLLRQALAGPPSPCQLLRGNWEAEPWVKKDRRRRDITVGVGEELAGCDFYR